MSTTDVLGIVGVVSVLGAYLLLQLGRLRAEHPGFSLANAIGAALILVSLSRDFNLPAALFEAGNWQEAAEALLRSHQLDATDPDPVYLLAATLGRAGAVDRARDVLRQAIPLYPSDPRFREALENLDQAGVNDEP